MSEKTPDTPENTIDGLRTELFETLRALRAKENPMDIDRARAIADVATVIVNSAKVEVNALNAMGRSQKSTFFPARALPAATAANPAAPAPPRSLKGSW